MDDDRTIRRAGWLASAALALCLPLAVSAQEPPAQASPTPTATPAPVLTDPRIPGDFSLPVGGNPTPVVGPARPADAPPREAVTQQVQPVPSSSPPRTEPQPRLDVEAVLPAPSAPNAPQQAVAPQSSPQSQTQAQTPARRSDTAPVIDDASDAPAASGIAAEPVPTTVADGEVAESLEGPTDSGFGWVMAAFLMSLLAIAALVVLLRRSVKTWRVRAGKALMPEVIVPFRGQTDDRPALAPPLPEQPEPEPSRSAARPNAGLVQSRLAAPARADDGLVTIRAPKANPVVPPAAVPSNGMVTINLTRKRQEQAEREARKRRPAAPPAVNRTISFDWS